MPGHLINLKTGLGLFNIFLIMAIAAFYANAVNDWVNVPEGMRRGVEFVYGDYAKELWATK